MNTPTVVVEALAEIEAVTSEDIEQARAFLQPPDESDTVLGTVDSEVVRAAFTAAHKSEHRAAQALVRATYEAPDPERRAALAVEAERLRATASFLREIAYMEARQELGAWKYKTIGLRKNFVLVMPAPRNPMANLLGLRLPIQGDDD